jgi:putative flippase GtrA
VTDASGAPRPRPTFWQWIKHHLASIAATVADYGVMVACVQLLHMRPVPATVLGALAGGVTNFTLGRVFTYKTLETGVMSQTWRYALVSAASLGWNAAGMHLFCDILDMQYIFARVITSVIVSNAWNYPLQRFFVFSHRRGRKQHPTAPPHDP